MSEDILNEIKNLNYAEIIKSIQIGIIQKCNNYNKNGLYCNRFIDFHTKIPKKILTEYSNHAK